jgi:hypothetical protein
MTSRPVGEREEMDAARSEIVTEIADCLARLSRASYLISPAQRIFIAEELRNVADAFDKGKGEKLRQRIRRGSFQLLALKGPNGKPLYRLK